MDDKGRFISHGQPAAFRQLTYQCHAISLRKVQDISRMLSFFTITTPWDTAITAFAYRIDTETMGDTPADDDDESKKETAHHAHFSEGFRDSNPRLPQKEDLGAGQKMLKLLQRWDVRNILLVSTRWDSLSFTDSADTPVRFGTLIGCAKHVLEVLYYESAGNAEDQPQELQEAPRTHQPPPQEQQEQPQATASPAPRHTGRTLTLTPAVTRVDTVEVPRYGKGPIYQRPVRSGVGSFMHGRTVDPPPVSEELLAIPPKKIKPRFRRLMLHDGPALTREQVTEFKAIRKPPPALLGLLVCTASLKQVYGVRDWAGVLDMLHRDGGSFLRRAIDLRLMRKDAVEAAREFLMQCDMELLRRSSPLSNVLLDWIIQVVQLVDFVVTSRPPPGSIWVDTDTLPKMPLPGTSLELDL